MSCHVLNAYDVLGQTYINRIRKTGTPAMVVEKYPKIHY